MNHAQLAAAVLALPRLRRPCPVNPLHYPVTYRTGPRRKTDCPFALLREIGERADRLEAFVRQLRPTPNP